MGKKEAKTNAIRILETMKIPYEAMTYECKEFVDGSHIADQLGLDIDKKKIVLNDPIKAIGSFEVAVKLHKEVTAKLAVKVVEA